MAVEDDVAELLSKTGFALRRGVRLNVVNNWIARGQLSNEALTPDGMIRIGEAERQLALMMRTGAGAPRGGVPAPGGVIADEESPAARRARAVAEMAELDLEKRRRRMMEEAGQYVLAEQVRANRGRALAQMLAAVDNWLPEVAGELALSRDGLAQLRASWRRFRVRQADSAAMRGASLPEMIDDDGIEEDPEPAHREVEHAAA